MPNWKKVIVSGSQAQVLSVTSSNGAQYSGSIYVAAGSNINVGQIAAASEASLVLGPPPAGGSGEGGQIALQPASGFTSGSFIDMYQTGTIPYLRLLRGTAASSDALIAQWNTHTKQFFLPAYTSVSSFPGTAVAALGINSSGDVITIATSSGGGGGSGTVNGGNAGFLAYYPTTGTTVDDVSGVSWNPGSSILAVTGSVIATANGAMYFRGGDDAEFWDINVANTVGIYGQQTQGIGAVKLGSGGPTLYGSGSRLGIGTTGPVATVDINGNLYVASGITGSLQGTATTASYVVTAQTASYVLQAVSASFATTASYVKNAQTASYVSNAVSASFATTASYVLNAVSSSFATTAATASYILQAVSSSYAIQAGNAATIDINVFGSPVSSYLLMSNVVGTTGVGIGGDADLRYDSSTNVLTVPNISATTLTGSLLGTASYASQTLSSSFASTASYVLQAVSASWAPPVFPFTGSAQITGSLGVTGSAVIGLSSSAQNRSVAFGEFVVASGTASFAHGNHVSASGNYSHAEGVATYAIGNSSHAEGGATYAIGNSSHAEGGATYAKGVYSHAEGVDTYAVGDLSHAEGQYAAVMEQGAHAEGLFTTAGGIRLINAQSSSGNYFTETQVYVEGDALTQYPNSCVAGNYIHFIAPFASPSPAPTDTEYDIVNTTILSSSYDSVENITRLLIPTMSNYASIDPTSGATNYVFLVNFEESATYNTWYGNNAHAEGYLTVATGRYAHAEGQYSKAFGPIAHAEGQGNYAIGTGSHAEGLNSTAGRMDTYIIDSTSNPVNGITQFTINSKYGDVAGDFNSSVFIQYYDPYDNVSPPAQISSSVWNSPNTIVSVYGLNIGGDNGGSIGYYNGSVSGDKMAGGKYAHSKGYRGQAWGEYSHAEGDQTYAAGNFSHAEGQGTIAAGAYSHTEGSNSEARGSFSHAEGYANIAYADSAHAEGEGTYAGGWALQVQNITNGEFFFDQAGDVTSYFTNGTQIVLYDFNGLISTPTAYTYIVNYSTWDGSNKTTVYLTDTTLNLGAKVLIGLYNNPEAFSFIDATYGVASHTAGRGSRTIGSYSYAGGDATIALGESQHVVGSYNQTSSAAGAFIIGNGSEGGGRNNLMLAYGNRVEVTGSVMATMGFTGSLLGTAATASFLLGSVASASFATTAATASFLLGSVASATSASVVQITNNTTTAATYYPTFVSSTSGHNALNVDSSALTWNPNTNTLTAANFAGNATSATSATTAGSATSATTATNANNVYNTSSPAGGNNIILFATSNQDTYVQPASDTSLVYDPTSKTFFARNVRGTTSLIISGSSILSGSTSIIGNVNQSGSLFVTSSQVTVGQFVGNQNGYVEFSVRNTSVGTNASGDIAVYADNGTPTTNFIDMGINSSTHAGAAYDGTFLGGKNDAYLFNDGGNLFIGNSTSTSISKSLFLFADPAGRIAMTITGSNIGFNKSSSLNANVDISGSAIISGSLRGNVVLPTITSNTASLDFSIANFFTCSLANGVTTHITASNYLPGQTINVLINQGSAGTGKVSFPAAFKSGSLYTGSAVANAVDIVTFITFDTSNIYLSAIRNLK